LAATIKDIAKKTGLGLATISSYLNGGNVREENRIKIEKAIKELHFEVNEIARGLKTNKTKTIGVVIPELSNIFCTEIITIIEDILRNHGYAAIVCDCRTDSKLEKEAVKFLYKKRVDGIINMPVTADGSHLKSFVEKGKPIVLIDRKLNNIQSDCVLVDNISAVKNAIEVLVKNGHEKIGMIAGPQDIFTAQERLLGYRLGLMEAGLIPEERLIAYGDYTIKSGVEQLKELVQNNPDMTAVVVSNGEMTVGALIGINELEISIPEKLSVIGYDNIEFAKAVNPNLTIVTQPTKEIAEHAARIMLERLEGSKNPAETVKLPTEIVHGSSIKNLL